MTGFSLIAAVVTAVFASLFSAAEGILMIFLFIVLLAVNCACMAANVCEEELNSTLFMAVICSALAVILCGVTVSSTITAYLCARGILDPEKIHPLIPLATVIVIIVMYRVLLQRARQNRLMVQKFGRNLKNMIDSRTYNPRLKRIRQRMIKEGILTERLSDDE